MLGNMRGKKGIDVSENNGHVDWGAVKDAGIDFAIIRLGYGNGHLDSLFYENINGAIDADLAVGVYYYSYALNVEAAKREAKFLSDVLIGCGMTAARLPMGVWFDMEDGDGYKRRNGMPSDKTLTNMCCAFIDVCRNRGFDKCGVYANLDWLENRLDTSKFGDDVLIWCAQWSRNCDLEYTALWQYTDKLNIGGHFFDGNICMAEV